MEIDYEKAYKEALERAREIKSKILSSHLSTESCKAVSEYKDTIIHELAESEDERMKKIITDSVFYQYGAGAEYKDVLDYLDKLEKQKESLHISEMCKEKANYFTDEDERIRKWLVDYFKAVERACIHWDISPERIVSYLEKQKEIPLMNGDADLYFDEWNQQKPNPTKRQCFEEGMKYAQRLQKEQTLTEWSEFDKGALEDAICATDLLGNDESFNKSNPNLAKAFRVAKDWLKSLPLNLKKKNEDVAKLCSNEWSEEDERKLKLCEDSFLVPQTRQHLIQQGLTPGDMVSWLNSLRPQITNSTPLYTIEQVDEKVREAQEWSEEDEKILNELLDYCNTANATWYNWLKSLRPPLKDKEMKLKILKYLSTRCSSLEFEEVENYLNNLRPSWKPSEEQLEALNALNCHGALSYVGQQNQLISLYNDLKKLI